MLRVRCAGPGGDLLFVDPVEIVDARVPADVGRAFERIDDALRNGYHVAGYVAYEAGAAFVPRQPAPAADAQALVRVGLYEAPAPAAPLLADGVHVGPLVPAVSRSRYASDIDTILAAIREGDVYQVNYAVPFSFTYGGDPFALYGALAQRSTVTYAALVDDGTTALLSCSPELFVSRTGDRLVTKPMKGTASIARAADLSDEKNRAEHVMIVDLLRNDLHRLSRDVVVERLFEVETYPSFVTMTSTIAATLPPATGWRDIFAAMFPCGSVTGAPKVAAMQTIAERERRSRGIFSGSIGYAAPDGSGIWNVAIRTATVDRTAQRGTMHVGGGIVADSDARSEWAEILTKASFLCDLAPSYALIETLASDASGALPLLEDHLTRLYAAADDLHFDCDARAIVAALRAAGRAPDTLVRIVVERNGRFAVTAQPLGERRADVDVCWAHEPLDEREPLRRYKTTWRPEYEAATALARQARCFDAVLRNRSGDVADGARTTLFVRRGDELVTPPVASGALPGVLRARLLASGAAIESRVTVEEVEGAAGVYVGNAARGLMRARIRSAVPAV